MDEWVDAIYIYTKIQNVFFYWSMLEITLLNPRIFWHSFRKFSERGVSHRPSATN